MWTRLIPLADMYDYWGNLLGEQGRYNEAIDVFTRALRRMEGVLEQEPQYRPARVALMKAHGGRAYLYEILGRYPDAVDDWRHVVALYETPRRTFRWSELTLALVRAGRHTQADSELETLAQQPNLAEDTLYNMACAYSLCAKAVRQDETLSSDEQSRLSEHCASQAMTLLTKAHGIAGFKDPSWLQYLKTGEELNALRTRPDFQKLLQEVEQSQ